MSHRFGIHDEQVVTQMTFFGLDEELVRATVFVVVFLLMVFAETAYPRKTRTQPRWPRWFTNVSLVLVNTFALRVFMPILAIGMAAYVDAKGWGLLGLFALPNWVEIVAAIVLLDLAIYAQHVASHKFPFLWRVHKVHHVDRDIDVTTGARFHPIEILLSMVFKLVCIALLGPAAIAVFLFELILSTTALFHHSNVRLPRSVDRLLRIFVVTPDTHRVHHSIVHHETDSNYGFFFSTWDRVFSTYIAQPQYGHDGMTIGVEGHQNDAPSHLAFSLLLPLKGESDQSAPE